MRVRFRLRWEAKKNSGGVLMMALITVMSVGMLMAAYLSHSSAVTRRQAHSIELKQSFYLAEAGLAESFAGLAIGKTGNVGTEAAPAIFGQGLFWVEATELDDVQVQLNCTAMVGQTQAELSLVAARGDVNVASLGIFGGDGVTIQPGTVIDAFDSEEAAYSEKTANGLARIGSNGAILLSGTREAPTNIAADIFAGPNDSVTKDGTVRILGETGSSPITTELPVISAPEITVDPGIVHSTETPLVIPEGTTGLERLEVGANAEVVIQGPAELLIEELVVQGGGTLELDTSTGPVDLYVSKEMTLGKGSSLITADMDTAAVSIQIVGELAKAVNLGGTSSFHGVIYAPESEVQVANGFDIYGAVVAKTLTFSGAANLHFDAYLQRMAEQSSLPTIVSWRILELSTDSDVFGTGDDPFEILGVLKSALDCPADCHEDQTLTISYLDGTSTLQTFTGMESAFDWTDVTVPLDVTRDGKDVADMGAGAKADPGVAMTGAVDNLFTTAPTSADLRDGLLAASPLPNETLITAIDEPNLLTSGHLRTVLEATPDLADSILLAAIADDTLTSSHMADVLISNSPISGAVRTAVSSRSSVMMNATDLMSIMALPIK